MLGFPTKLKTVAPFNPRPCGKQISGTLRAKESQSKDGPAKGTSGTQLLGPRHSLGQVWLSEWPHSSHPHPYPHSHPQLHLRYTHTSHTYIFTKLPPSPHPHEPHTCACILTPPTPTSTPTPVFALTCCFALNQTICIHLQPHPRHTLTHTCTHTCAKIHRSTHTPAPAPIFTPILAGSPTVIPMCKPTATQAVPLCIP